MSSTVASCGQVDGLRDRARDERLHGAHHLQVAHVRDRALADGDVEHRQVLLVQAGRADDRAVLGQVGLDLLDLLLGVAERLQRQRHGAVDDRHLPAADELLELDQREVRLDAGRVAVHQEGDRAGRREHRGLRVAVAVTLAELDGLVPRAPRRREQPLVRAGRLGDRVSRVAVHAHHVVVRLAVLRVALVGPERGRDLGRAPVGAAGHQRGDRRRRVASGVGVVGHAVAHQVGAEVGVAEAELAERTRVDGDLLGRVAGGPDDDLLGQQHDVDGVLEGLHVERAVGAAELHQVQRGQVAGRVVDVHVLACRGWTR